MKEVKSAIDERVNIEKDEKNRNTVEEDGQLLEERFKTAKKRAIVIFPKINKSILEPSILKKRKKINYYSESETLIFLLKFMDLYPNFFDFDILDYNTSKGIDFVVEHKKYPRYIELKGTMVNYVNHSFRNIYKFICYDLEFGHGDIVTDYEFKTRLSIGKSKFVSRDNNFNGLEYTSYFLKPHDEDLNLINPMEIIVLKKLLPEILGTKIQKID